MIASHYIDGEAKIQFDRGGNSRIVDAFYFLVLY